PRRRLAERPSRGRSAARSLRADDPQLRPVHLLRDPLPRSESGAAVRGVVVVGVGRADRGDVGAGVEVGGGGRGRGAGGVEVVVCEQEASRVIDAIEDREAAVLVDASSSGSAPGTIHRYDASSEPVPARAFRSSTHAFGVGEAIELARALGKLPPMVVVY